MIELLEDLRSAMRQALRRPAFHLLVAAILAVGIGATTAMFTLADAALFRGLPIQAPERVLRVFTQNERGSPEMSNASVPQGLALAQFKSFINSAYYAEWFGVQVGPAGAPPERLTAAVVSGGFFDTLGIRAAHGRLLGSDDDRTFGGHPVVVVSHHYWRTRMGADPDAIGSTLRINRHPFTVVGVAPAGFDALDSSTQVALWVPMTMVGVAATDGFFTEARMRSAGFSWADLVVRLAPGVTQASAQAELDAWSTTEAAQIKASGKSEGNGPWFKLVPAAQAMTDPYGTEGTARNAWLLSGVVALLLALASANVAGLLAVRADERAREFALRKGLGATRGRLLRQLLVECGALALVGAVAGIGLARLLLEWIAREAPSGVIVPLDPSAAVLDPRTLVAAIVATAIATLLAGLLPAWRAARVDVASALKASGSATTAGRGALELRGALIALQVGVSVVLLVSAGLLLRAFWATATVDPGFDPRGAAVVTLDLASHGVPPEQRLAAFERIRARVAALPGVTATGWANNVPVRNGGMSNSIQAEGSKVPEDRGSNAELLTVSPGYRATLGLPLLAGRDLAEHEAGPVVLINHAMAEKFWPGQDPIGRRILNFNTEQGGAVVVGVFGDHRQRSLRQAPQPALMLPFDQDAPSQLQLLVRTAGDAALLLPMVQRAIAELEPELLVQRPQTLEQRVERSYSEARLFAFLVAGFATLALALAAAGLYGVLAHSLRQRSRELGIRVALGATRGSIVALVLGQTGRMVGAGLLLGIAGAFAIGRALEGLLFGVAARDPLTMVGVSVLVVAVAALAVLAPVRRAAATDPAIALRDE